MIPRPPRPTLFPYTTLFRSGMYQVAKRKNFNTGLDYDEWYAEKFEIAKKEVISEYDIVNDGIKAKTAQVKPSLKEFSNRVLSKFKIEYREWQEKVNEDHSEMRFILRLLDVLKKYDSILVALSTNMRTEMRTLSAVNRANKVVDNFNNNEKNRSSFPSKEQGTRKKVN